MPRQAVRIQRGNFGTDNPSSFNGSYANRAATRPVVLQRGPSQAIEQFGSGVPAPVARALNQVQKNVESAVSVAKNNPFADGNLIEGVTFVNGVTTVVPHGLGAPARGYVIMDSDDIYFSVRVAQTPTSLEDVQIAIQCQNNGSMTASVWVFK